MPLSIPKKISAGYQPIDGYTLEEMIGRGGFGEVWRADAPGGIKKAVKFVFGDHADHRAERELKSLERIKGVQHPFLLTLERFEIVEGQLVIVTELADGSLEDIFTQHRDRGSCGIPRNALLTYMHDAADALDYLHEMYQLQHLDIKPANLLMVGGHVKVADFGLLKDLRDADCSMIGGLTPIYAPPEVFDGKPSMNSDQYSLAVMYQELLTGVRPFSGRSIAQLATQHVHNSPNLESLPSSDQPIIARALEKNPDRRYTSCRAFVEELREPQRRSSGVPLETKIGANNLGLELGTKEVLDLPQLEDANSVTGQAEPPQSTGTPVLVVALGGSGARCVLQLRRQLAATTDAPIALHAVTIDTDITSLNESGRFEPSKTSPWYQSLHTPLRSAQEYRARGTDHLRTVSRRWLHNVPRSGQTEGMRPLGRMALVDHGTDVSKSIREAVHVIVNASTETKPLVFVVGSTSGGTSSGMYIDVVHVVRHCLDEAGLEGAQVISLLLAPAMRNDPRRPLVLHDTKALLSEIGHLMKPGNGYPGDEGAGWDSIPAARTPLCDAYVIAASTEPGMPSPIQSVCDYIYLAGTGASDLLGSARRGRPDENSTTIDTSAVRSLGVIRLSGARTREHRVMASTAARQLLLQWLGNPSHAREAAPRFADRMKRRSRLGLTEFTGPIIRSLGDDRNARRAKLMLHLRSLPVELLCDSVKCQENLRTFVMSHAESRESNSILFEVAETLQRELSARLHDRESDLSIAIEAMRILAENLRSEIVSGQEQRLKSSRSAPRENRENTEHLKSNQLESIATSPDESSQTSVVDVSQIAALRTATGNGEDILSEFAHQQACLQLTDLCDMLGRLEGRLCDGAAKVAQSIRSTEAGGNKRADPWEALQPGRREELQLAMGEAHGRLASKWLIRLLSDEAATIDPIEMSTRLICELESIMTEDLDSATSRINESSGDGSSSTIINGPTTMSRNPLSTDPHESVTKVGDSLALTSTLGELSQHEKQPIVIQPPTVEDAIRAVRPPLLLCGGSQRLILIVGSEEEKSHYEASVRQAHDGELTVAVIPDSIPTLIHEAQQIKIDDILERLSSLTTGQDEICRRLHSRCDIDW